MNGLKLDLAKKHFELIKSVNREGVETWSARDLMPRLGYERWENFEKVIQKAITTAKNSGIDPMGHFREFTKVLDGNNGSKISVKDYHLTRYACYIIAQNGDSSKEQIALAQTYFAFQTRKQELIQEHTKELERLTAREKLSTTEKKFSGLLFEHGVDSRGIATIRAKGDQALFGGNSTFEMKQRLEVPENRPLADFLPTITIKAKDLATEMTTFKTKEKGLNNQDTIGITHQTHNQNVRKVLVDEGIYPENLPREEDIKVLERKIKKEFKALGVPDLKQLTVSEVQVGDQSERLIIRIPSGVTAEHLQAINQVLRDNVGDTPVVIELGHQSESVRRLDIKLTVQVTKKLKEDIDLILASINL